MADLNKVFLMGRLTFDPELRRTATQTAVTQLRLATTRTWQSREGERREETLYIDVVVWDRAAENCCQYLRKGSSVHVEGSLKMDTWDDKNTGEKRSKILVHADRVQFLDSKRSEGGMDLEEGYVAPREPARRSGAGGASRPVMAESRPSRPAQGAGGGPARNEQPDMNDDEDIPF